MILNSPTVITNTCSRHRPTDAFKMITLLKILLLQKLLEIAAGHSECKSFFLCKRERNSCAQYLLCATNCVGNLAGHNEDLIDTDFAERSG